MFLYCLVGTGLSWHMKMALFHLSSPNLSILKQAAYIITMSVYRCGFGAVSTLLYRVSSKNVIFQHSLTEVGSFP